MDFMDVVDSPCNAIIDSIDSIEPTMLIGSIANMKSRKQWNHLLLGNHAQTPLGPHGSSNVPVGVGTVRSTRLSAGPHRLPCSTLKLGVEFDGPQWLPVQGKQITQVKH